MAAQTLQDVLNDRLIIMEFADWVTNIFVAVIAEKLQFCSVGPQNRPIRCYPMHGNDCALQIVPQLRFAPLKQPFSFSAFRNFGFECLCSLLQFSDDPIALVISSCGEIVLLWNHIAVLRTDPYKRFMVFMAAKSGHGVGATQREGMGPGENVPQLFEADSCIAFPV